MTHETDGWPLLESQGKCLLNTAEDRYWANKDKEEENPWWVQEPRWHIYKAQDQMSIASYHYRKGELGMFEVNMADAFNHMLMAFLTLGTKEGCHPVMEE